MRNITKRGRDKAENFSCFVCGEEWGCDDYQVDVMTRGSDDEVWGYTKTSTCEKCNLPMKKTIHLPIRL